MGKLNWDTSLTACLGHHTDLHFGGRDWWICQALLLPGQAMSFLSWGAPNSIQALRCGPTRAQHRGTMPALVLLAKLWTQARCLWPCWPPGHTCWCSFTVGQVLSHWAAFQALCPSPAALQRLSWPKCRSWCWAMAGRVNNLIIN